jgi:hypothetical protein
LTFFSRSKRQGFGCSQFFTNTNNTTHQIYNFLFEDCWWVFPSYLYRCREFLLFYNFVDNLVVVTSSCVFSFLQNDWIMILFWRGTKFVSKYDTLSWCQFGKIWFCIPTSPWCFFWGKSWECWAYNNIRMHNILVVCTKNGILVVQLQA